MTQIPEDLYTTPTLATTIKALAARSDARRKTYIELADLLYGEYLKELAKGTRNWIRDNPTFSMFSKKQVSERVSVVKLFRLPAPDGLGYSRVELENVPVNRLRTIAPHSAWAFKHPERVREVLDPAYKMTAKDLLAEIRLYEEAAA